MKKKQKMINKKVSIIIPVYNNENYISQGIESVENQTYKNYEIIIIDDGSTDDSLKLCKKFEKRNDKIKVISINNGGVSNARNIGIKNASGDYVCFIDSDDYVMPTYIESLIKKMNNKCLVISAYSVFNEKKDRQVKKINKQKLYIGIDIYLKIVRNELFWNQPWNKMYNLNVIKENKLFFNDKLNMGEDLVFNLNYLNFIDNIFYINKTIYRHRINDNGAMANNNENKLKALSNILLEMYNKENEKEKKCIIKLYYLRTIWNLYKISGNTEYLDIINSNKRFILLQKNAGPLFKLKVLGLINRR